MYSRGHVYRIEVRQIHEAVWGEECGKEGECGNEADSGSVGTADRDA